MKYFAEVTEKAIRLFFFFLNREHGVQEYEILFLRVDKTAQHL